MPSLRDKDLLVYLTCVTLRNFLESGSTFCKHYFHTSTLDGSDNYYMIVRQS